MRVWTVKCREKKADGEEGWHWERYFDPDLSAYEEADSWGGRDWINSPRSWGYLREKASKGDIVVCYQYEGRRIIGLTLMSDDPTQDTPPSGPYNTIHLPARRDAFSLLEETPPLTVQRLRDRGCDPRCFGRNTQGTVFLLNAKEFGGIVDAIGEDYPHLRASLHRWLKKAGYSAK